MYYNKNVDQKLVDKIKGENGDVNDISLTSVFRESQKILLSIPEKGDILVDPFDKKANRLFKNVKYDTGQFERIVSNVANREYDYRFPSAFIHFIDVRYLVAQNRTNEGRAIMRIRYILNNLNNQDFYQETYPFEVFEKINSTFQKAALTNPAFSQRLSLQYWDALESYDMLQPYWINYEVYFKANEGYEFNDWVRMKLITPQFTNYDDIPGNTKPNTPTPEYDDQTGFYPKPYPDEE